MPKLLRACFIRKAVLHFDNDDDNEDYDSKLLCESLSPAGENVWQAVTCSKKELRCILCVLGLLAAPEVESRWSANHRFGGLICAHLKISFNTTLNLKLLLML